MKYSIAVLALANTAVASWGAWSQNVTYTTEIVTALTTYCPEATMLTHGGKTYTITEATTLTITDCPCTLTKPVMTTPTPSTILYTSCPPSSEGPAPTYAPKPVAPVSSYSNPLTVIYSTPAATQSGAATGTGKYVAPSVPANYVSASGASANRVGVLVAGAVAGIVALAL